MKLGQFFRQTGQTGTCDCDFFTLVGKVVDHTPVRLPRFSEAEFLVTQAHAQLCFRRNFTNGRVILDQLPVELDRPVEITFHLLHVQRLLQQHLGLALLSGRG